MEDRNTMLILANLILVFSLIFVGSFFGAFANWFKESDKDPLPIKNVVFGMAISFICVPFFSSVIHIQYDKLILPLVDVTTDMFLQQALLLISISGIASYLGYRVLDNIAEKIMEKVEKVEKESDDIMKDTEELKAQYKKTQADMAYMQAVTAMQRAIKENSPNLMKQSLEYINAAIDFYKNDKKSEEYERSIVCKSYILKRLGMVKEALAGLEEISSLGVCTPTILYNMACYKNILRKELADSHQLDEIKSLIKKMLAFKTSDEEDIKRIARFKSNIINDGEKDLSDVFTKDELDTL